MKTYRKTSELLAEVEAVFAAKRTRDGGGRDPHPLEHVLLILLPGRQYSRLELAIDVDEAHCVEYSLGSSDDAHSICQVPLRTGAKHMGELRAFSDRENTFSSEDHILLKNVARLIAQFLSGPGKHIVRHGHEQSVAAATQVATAGENARS